MNIRILSPKSLNCHHHKITDITLSSTSLSPNIRFLKKREHRQISDRFVHSTLPGSGQPMISQAWLEITGQYLFFVSTPVWIILDSCQFAYNLQNSSKPMKKDENSYHGFLKSNHGLKPGGGSSLRAGEDLHLDSFS